MAKILDEAKSSIGSPYVFYTVYADEVVNSRTPDSVKIDVSIYAHLQYSASYLGSGYPLTGYLTLNGVEYSTQIKASSATWSGTTSHRVDAQFTVNNLAASANKLTNVKFRVMSRSASDSGYMPNTNCSDISITIGHNIPSDVSFTMTETNPLLTSAGVSNDMIVENLSLKSINVSYTLHDGATLTNVGVYNRTTPYSSASNPFTLDLSTITLLKDNNDPTKIPLMAFATDSVNTKGYSSTSLFSYITYTPVLLNNSTTIAKRVGQTSGQVALDINGGFFNGIVGNVDQTSYKPVIKYKYWKYGDSEPATYGHTISSSNISVSDNTFSVSSLNIGSTIDTDVNYFNPDYAYRVKIYVEDNFTNTESNELQIQVGEALWTEYKDRVDFKELTIGGDKVLESNIDNNIYYEKRSDGVGICYGSVAVSTTDTRSAGGLSYYSGEQSVSLPITYTNTNTMVGFSSVQVANMNRFCQSYVTIEGVDEIKVYYTNTTSESRNINFIVIGKWK